MDSITVFNEAFVPFMAMVRQRPADARRRSRTGEVEIAFYDLGKLGRPGEPGQFVCSYYASAIANVEGPLALHFGTERWTLDRAACSMLTRWIRSGVLAAAPSTPGDQAVPGPSDR